MDQSINMKANKLKGNARKGARKATFTIKLKEAADYCGEKITITRTRERVFNKSNKPTLASTYWNSVLNSPNYGVFMNKYRKRSVSLAD